MAISKEKKKNILKKLEDIFSGSKSVVFVNFHGLNVSDINNIRKEFKNKGVKYYVAKKTLTKMALDKSGLKGENLPLDGEVALAFGDDTLAPAREVYAFQGKYPESFNIIGGVFEDKLIGREGMLSIASIPPIEVLYGKFVNIINSPIQRFAIALNEIAKQKGA